MLNLSNMYVCTLSDQTFETDAVHVQIVHKR